MEALTAPLALLLERLIGYPAALLRTIGHPVIWMGGFIGWADARFNRAIDSAAARRRAGIAMLLGLLVVTLAACLTIRLLATQLPYGFVLEAVLASTLLAQNELGRAVHKVADGLDRSLAEGRRAVRHIVGRDPEVLDEAGICRAAVESLAESSSDGVVAPLFWLVLLGLPGIALYKAVNTADSMVGHLSDRHRDFGWASARLDDLLNLAPARLTALLIAGAAFLARDAEPERAWSMALRDAKKHASPNAGWPEAAMAGALGLSLGGPRSYGGETLDLPEFGDGRQDLGAADIRRALGLYGVLLNLLLVATACIAVAQWRFVS